MDGAALLDRVREDGQTELDRLGSEKALLAATEARLETDAVLVTAAAVLAEASETVASWSDAATADAAADVLQTAAETLGDARDRVVAELDDEVSTADIAAVDVPFLTLEADGDVERVATAAVALPLVLDRLFLQSVSFFVNEADTARADLFRDLRGATDDVLAAGQDALDAVCEDDADWDRAATAVTGTVDAAYDDYASRLDAMGFDPKPIC
ncbi:MULTISPECIES: rubrerythrin family protein [Salinibaculum]|uniref:rubrerythrin family protein n=1 Tax=Salinibaculum TaxID=2732368 RepID=UPI0030CD0666